MKRQTDVWVLTVLAILFIAPRVANSQDKDIPPVVAIVVASSDLPNGAKSVVIVRPHSQQSNIVLIDTSRAGPDDLAASLSAVAQLRARYGNSLPGELRLVLRTTVLRAGSQVSEAAKANTVRMKSHLRSLKGSHERVIEGFGKHKALDVVLPAIRKTPVLAGRQR